MPARREWHCLGIVKETIRAFVATYLPLDVVKALAGLQARLQSNLPKDAVRWTPPEQLHLTLKFLGNVAAAHLVDLKAALEAVCLRSPPLVV